MYVFQGIAQDVTFVVFTTLASKEKNIGYVTLMSYMYIGSAVSSAVGIIVCGVLYDRLNKDLYFVISGIILTVSIAMAPILSQSYGYLGFIFVAKFSLDLVWTGEYLNTDCAKFWHSYEYLWICVLSK